MKPFNLSLQNLDLSNPDMLLGFQKEAASMGLDPHFTVGVLGELLKVSKESAKDIQATRDSFAKQDAMEAAKAQEAGAREAARREEASRPKYSGDPAESYSRATAPAGMHDPRLARQARSQYVDSIAAQAKEMTERSNTARAAKEQALQQVAQQQASAPAPAAPAAPAAKPAPQFEAAPAPAQPVAAAQPAAPAKREMPVALTPFQPQGKGSATGYRDPSGNVVDRSNVTTITGPDGKHVSFQKPSNYGDYAPAVNLTPFQPQGKGSATGYRDPSGNIVAQSDIARVGGVPMYWPQQPLNKTTPAPVAQQATAPAPITPPAQQAAAPTPAPVAQQPAPIQPAAQPKPPAIKPIVPAPAAKPQASLAPTQVKPPQPIKPQPAKTAEYLAYLRTELHKMASSMENCPYSKESIDRITSSEENFEKAAREEAQCIWAGIEDTLKKEGADEDFIEGLKKEAFWKPLMARAARGVSHAFTGALTGGAAAGLPGAVAGGLGGLVGGGVGYKNLGLLGAGGLAGAGYFGTKALQNTFGDSGPDITGLAANRNRALPFASNQATGAAGGALLGSMLANEMGATGHAAWMLPVLGGLGGYHHLPKMMDRWKDPYGMGVNYISPGTASANNMYQVHM